MGKRSSFPRSKADDYATPLMSAAVTLNAAYDIAKERAAQAEQERRDKLDMLRREKSKLARSVEDGDLSLEAAVAAYQEEKRIERARKERTTGYLNRAMETLQAPDSVTPECWAQEMYRDLDPNFLRKHPTAGWMSDPSAAHRTCSSPLQIC